MLSLLVRSLLRGVSTTPLPTAADCQPAALLSLTGAQYGLYDKVTMLRDPLLANTSHNPVFYITGTTVLSDPLVHSPLTLTNNYV